MRVVTEVVPAGVSPGHDKTDARTAPPLTGEMTWRR